MERFKLSRDPQFEAKVRDVVASYLDPPDRALVLCVDEKSRIQTLDCRVRSRGPAEVLGASRSNVVRMVLRETLLVSMAGCLAGVAAALVLSRYQLSAYSVLKSPYAPGRVRSRAARRK